MSKLRRQKMMNSDPESVRVSKFNELAEDVSNAVNGRLTFADNMYAEVKTIDYVSSAVPVRIKTSLPRPPMAVWVLGAHSVGNVDLAVSSTNISGSTVTWSYGQGGDIEIKDISGLVDDVLYQVKIVFVAG